MSHWKLSLAADFLLGMFVFLAIILFIAAGFVGGGYVVFVVGGWWIPLGLLAILAGLGMFLFTADAMAG